MIVLLAAWLVTGGALATATIDAGLSRTVAWAALVGCGIMFFATEAMRRSSTFSSATVLSLSAGGATGCATAVGWLDRLAETADVAPALGYAVAGALILAGLGGTLAGWWD